jgi:hypothetical protein
MPLVRRCLACLCVLALAGCVLGEEDSLGRDDLPGMIVGPGTVRALGKEYAGLLRHNEDSGAVSQAEAADATVDPDDTPDDLVRAGRRGGYAVSYDDPQFAAFTRRKGLLGVNFSVDLFRDQYAAAKYLRKLTTDYQDLRGQVIDDDSGARLFTARRFAVKAVGHQAIGFEYAAGIGRVRAYSAYIAFRRGPVVAGVQIGRADKRYRRAHALKLARAFDRRIQSVLGGEAPDTEDLVVKAKPRSSLSRLAAMALQPTDVGKGVTVADNRKVQRDNTEASFARQFDLNEIYVRVGRSFVTRLVSEVDLYETQGDATLSLRLLSGKEGRRILTRAIVDGFSEKAGLKPPGFRLEQLPRTLASAQGYSVTFDGDVGRVEGVFYFVRVGRGITAVSAFGLERQMRATDILRLASRAKTRLARGLAKS